MPPVIFITVDSQIMPLVMLVIVYSAVMPSVMSITVDSLVMPLVMLITVDSQVMPPVTTVTVDLLFMLPIMSITDGSKVTPPASYVDSQTANRTPGWYNLKCGLVEGKYYFWLGSCSCLEALFPMGCCMFVAKSKKV